MTKNKFYFTIKDLMLIALITAVATGAKTVIGIIVRSFTGIIGIPGGAIAGGLYMLWLPLVLIITKKRGSAFLLCLLQSIIMLITSLAGSHGFWNFVTYLAPGIVVELIYIIKKAHWDNILVIMLAVVGANVTGTIGSNLLFFKLSALPFTFMLFAAVFSGVVGSFIGKGVAVLLAKQGLVRDGKKARNATDESNASLTVEQSEGFEQSCEEICEKKTRDSASGSDEELCDSDNINECRDNKRETVDNFNEYCESKSETSDNISEYQDNKRKNTDREVYENVDKKTVNTVCHSCGMEYREQSLPKDGNCINCGAKIK